MFLSGPMKFIVAAFVAFGFALDSFAAPRCHSLFSGAEVKSVSTNFGLQNTPFEISTFKNTQSELYSTLEKLPAQRKAEVEHLLAAVEFFDYAHTADAIFNNFLSGNNKALDFTRRYDNGEFTPGAPYFGFLNARDNYLRRERPAVTPELLKEIHARIMINGVEGVREDQLGVFRYEHWVGNAFGANRLTEKEVQTISNNPYLYFKETSRAPAPLSEALWSQIKIWGSQKNMISQSQHETLIEGKIHYPYMLTPKQETVDLIKGSHPEVYQEVMSLRQKKSDSLFWFQKNKDLEQKFTQALIEERFARFNAERAALGDIKIGLNERRYIEIVADFQRDLVAIHPLLNGNGRTTRLLMNYLLTKEGLPPVRLVDPFLDVQASKEEWREFVHKGVVNSAQLHADILYRIKNGLTVEHSPELVYPGLPEMISISLKKQGKKSIVEDYAQVKLESEQFNAFLKTLFEQHPELRQELANNRTKTMSRLTDLFVEYYRSKTIRHIHNKDGERELGLRLVDPDFIETFGLNRSHSKILWENKINRWYEKDMLVWRGLANRQKELTREDLLNYFKTPTAHLVSNRVLRSLHSGKSLVEAIKDDFKVFNKEVITGELTEMAMDHHRTGPKYGISYGYSTSKREVVGKAFAMGAMVVGKYGEHQDPKLQAQIKSRINVASYRALKDVDLGRLKAFDPEFSYKYGRQAEVMGIGGVDADAVMLVQRLDSQGSVVETLLRNFENPNEIFLIEGRYVPEEGPLPTERIKSTFKLK